MTSKKYKMLRNIFILIGMVGGFLIWLGIPAFFKNNALFHVGNGTYGSKLGFLLLLGIPLFSLIQDKEEITVHSDDEEIKEEILQKNYQKQMTIAFALSIMVLILMAGGLLC